MSLENLTTKERSVAIKAQRLEMTEHTIYAKLARVIRDKENAAVLGRIAEDELNHYTFWASVTGKEMKPARLVVAWFVFVSRFFGLTFGIKLLERGEEKAQVAYGEVLHLHPEVQRIIDEEDAHEHELIEMLEEEHLQYVGSVVLGLNDALVELTGALAGLTFALQNTRLTALAGLITGIAASFSMAASEYLSTKSEGGENAGKSALYTGVAYIVTVILLVMPYLLVASYLVSLLITIAIAILIIFVFNYYISIAKDYSFRKRFFEMAGLSLGVAIVSFGIGYVIRVVLGVEV